MLVTDMEDFDAEQTGNRNAESPRSAEQRVDPAAIIHECSSVLNHSRQRASVSTLSADSLEDHLDPLIVTRRTV